MNKKGKLVRHQLRLYIPKYAISIGNNWSVNITTIGKIQTPISCSEFDSSNGCFNVYGLENTKFYWTCYGMRGYLDPEPYKNTINVKGDGPYKWIT